MTENPRPTLPSLTRREFAAALSFGPLLSVAFPANPPEAPSRDRREELLSLLGDLPPRDRKISVTTVGVEERSAYVLEKLTLDLNGFEPVPAYFVKPKSLAGKAPAVLYNHAHGGNYKLGKQELLEGRKELVTPPYGEFLTSLEMSVLCVDAWLFGERSGREELDLFKEMIWKGQVLWGMMVYDSLRALDYLVSRPEVDPARIATLGLSMGSAMAQWVAALDERVKVCVDLCCLTDYQTLLENHDLKAHGIYYYVPRLLKHFSAAEINALIAPRAHLSLDGTLDHLAPAAGLDLIEAELRKVYGSSGHPERWSLLRYPVGHQEAPEMRGPIEEFLRRFL